MESSKSEIKIIRECLNAVVNGPFIPDWEFHTLFGFTKKQVDSILKVWPNVNQQDDMIKLAINNSLNNLLGYPIDHIEKWETYISVSRDQLEEFYSVWRSKNYTDEPNSK